jgi:glycosyltransferase involved in cell wall biosynthesis
MNCSKSIDSKTLKVGFFGNNLNLAFNVVTFLARAGFHCTWIGFAKSSMSPQDDPSWQGCSLDTLSCRVILGDDPLFNPLSPEYRLIKSKIARTCRDLDILFLSEDGPSWFIGEKLPKYFVSQGGDLQDFPFFINRAVQHSISCLFNHCPNPISIFPAHVHSLNTSRNLSSSILKRSLSTLSIFIAKSLRQLYQRRGLHLCDKLFITPNQISITDRLHIPRNKTRFVPIPTFAKTIPSLHSRHSANEHLDYVTSLSCSYLVFFSPTRILLKSKAKIYPKHNDYLIRSLALLSKNHLDSIKLVLVRKGSSADLSTLDSLIEFLGLTRNIHWIPEQPAFQLSNFYKINNLVVCDQYSDKLAYLGAIGREATCHGKLLLTAFSGWNSLYYGADLPPHVFPCFNPNDIASSISSIVSLDRSEFSDVSRLAQQWYQRWHSPSAAIRQFIHSIFSDQSRETLENAASLRQNGAVISG